MDGRILGYRVGELFYSPEDVTIVRDNSSVNLQGELERLYGILRQVISKNFHPGLGKEQALLRLAESEMWLGHGKPKVPPEQNADIGSAKE